MTAAGSRASLRVKGAPVNTALTAAAVFFVVSVLALVAYSLFELSPFARHRDVYRGRERQRSPRLD